MNGRDLGVGAMIVFSVLVVLACVYEFHSRSEDCRTRGGTIIEGKCLDLRELK